MDQYDLSGEHAVEEAAFIVINSENLKDLSADDHHGSGEGSRGQAA